MLPVLEPFEGEVISEYGLVIIEPEETNCFSINFQVFTNSNQHNFINIHFKFITVQKRQKEKSYSIVRIQEKNLCYNK